SAAPAPAPVGAATALVTALLPPAVARRGRPAGGTPWSAVTLWAMASSSSGSPSTGPYRWSDGCRPKEASTSMACGGGPYETMPCPREMVPGVERISSPRIGMIGGWMSVMRRGRCMGSCPAHILRDLTPTVGPDRAEAGRASSEAERHAGRPAPELEVAQVEVAWLGQVVVGVVVGEVAELPQIATDGDVLAQEHHDAAADVHAEVVARQVVEEVDEGEIRPHQAEAGREVRLHLAVRQRHEHVAHQRRHAAFAAERPELVLGLEEVRRVPVVDL